MVFSSVGKFMNANYSNNHAAGKGSDKKSTPGEVLEWHFSYF
jgi:hypothetical protein